jgi:hypothetical protein
MSHAMEAAPLATRLTTYAELQQIVQAFARGHLNLLILIGGHGTRPAGTFGAASPRLAIVSPRWRIRRLTARTGQRKDEGDRALGRRPLLWRT